MLAKFYFLSISSQNLNECSLARAPKFFAVDRMLAFLSVLVEIFVYKVNVILYSA